MKITNGHIVILILSFALGAFIGNCGGRRDAATINAVLSHQVDEQTRLIADVVGVEAADEIRRMSHDAAVMRARE